MTQTLSEQSMTGFKRHLTEYRPQLEKALQAIQVLETANLESEEFVQALADLHVCATVLEPYSEGMLEAINQFTYEQSENL
ncbi:hypothetical protein PN498_23920 [Oscillatoria sp. CS-180]|uniref:hypothetical protein n=1 Tax=Oscillatoria sp. CS-180 TaxID=3021720 RepID=UPI00232D8DDC|nr:hypothetical protein [Oscillatoria sp. CS-180]MDB9529062.1 hypothetical protein [Oscillatoria sp. CS-180]